MLDCNDLLVSIKTAAMDAVNASKQSGILFGNVTSVNPLKINIEQKLTLSMAQLILTRNVTDYTVSMTVSHQTELSQEALVSTHTHNYEGEKSFLVHNALTIGEKVVMVQALGGQKFIVIDRVAL